MSVDLALPVRKRRKYVTSRGWCFTWNNYPDDAWSAIVQLDAVYAVAGEEVAPSTGTKHLQGYVYFANARVMPKVAGAHWEPQRGTPRQNIAYCKKTRDGDIPNEVVHEYGQPPMDQDEKGVVGADIWREAMDNAMSGDFLSIPPRMLVSHLGSWMRLRALFGPRPDDLDSDPKLCNEWHWGEAGVGKSRSVRAKYSVFYSKMKNKWWDGYLYEDVVVIDDWDPKTSEFLTSHLKEWADRYSFTAEVKGTAMRIRPKRIVVTSQYSIETCFPDVESYQAMCRRFHVYHHYGDVVLFPPK